MRGIFNHHHEHEHGTDAVKEYKPCIITHSQSTATLSEWDADSDSDKSNERLPIFKYVSSPSNANDSKPKIKTNKKKKKEPAGIKENKLPPIIEDTTELEHSRRVEIATSHGFTYDEAHGVQSILGALTPHEKEHLADANMPLRHYRAEKGNLPQAIRKIKSTLKWREEFDVEGIKRCFDKKQGGAIISPEKQTEQNHLAEVIAQENETGKIYCRGYDKQGRAILYLTPGRENSNDEINNMRHLVYHLERAIACTRQTSGREKICIVIGYAGFKLSNAPPMSTVKHTLTILQGHYPERMYRAYICDPPLVFRSFWSIIKHFVDPATLEKIAFCTGKEGSSILERDFNTDITERQAGGTKLLREFRSREFLFDTPFDCTFDEKRA